MATPDEFKRYVHGFLDEAGVPSDPDPDANAKTGCRIGGRLRWLIARHEAAMAALEPIYREVVNRRSDFQHPTWNEEAHVELTLTIGEIRVLAAAIGKAACLRRFGLECGCPDCIDKLGPIHPGNIGKPRTRGGKDA